MFKYFNLLTEIVRSDFKLRYRGSFLGVFWSLLRPFLTFLVLYSVFSQFLRFDIPHYHIYLFLGIIIWNFFSEATNLSILFVSQKADLIKKVFFPKNIIVFSAVSLAFINLLINFSVFLIFFAVAGFLFTELLFLVPFLLLPLVLFIIGFSFFLVISQVRFRDTGYIWDFLLQLGFWLTPIVYPITMIPDAYQKYIFLNPLTQAITSIRELMMYQRTPDPFHLTILFLLSLLIFNLGFFLFQKRQMFFAEEI